LALRDDLAGAGHQHDHVPGAASPHRDGRAAVRGASGAHATGHVGMPVITFPPRRRPHPRKSLPIRSPPCLSLLAAAACGAPDQPLVPEAEPEALRTPSHLVDSTVSEPFGPTVLIARPLQLVASERYLFIIDISPPHVHVLDAVTGARRRSFGREGEGPGDFPHAPLGVARSARGDTIWFYHALQGRLSGVATQDLTDETRPTASPTRQVSPGAWTFAIDGPDAAGNLLALNQTPTGIETLTYSLTDDRITR